MAPSGIFIVGLVVATSEVCIAIDAYGFIGCGVAANGVASGAESGVLVGVGALVGTGFSSFVIGNIVWPW